MCLKLIFFLVSKFIAWLILILIDRNRRQYAEKEEKEEEKFNFFVLLCVKIV